MNGHYQGNKKVKSKQGFTSVALSKSISFSRIIWHGTDIYSYIYPCDLNVTLLLEDLWGETMSDLLLSLSANPTTTGMLKRGEIKLIVYNQDWPPNHVTDVTLPVLPDQWDQDINLFWIHFTSGNLCDELEDESCESQTKTSYIICNPALILMFANILKGEIVISVEEAPCCDFKKILWAIFPTFVFFFYGFAEGGYNVMSKARSQFSMKLLILYSIESFQFSGLCP